MELTQRLIMEISKNPNRITLNMLNNVFQYVDHFPADFKTMFYKDVQDIVWVRTKLLSVKKFKEWFEAQKGGDTNVG